MCHCCVHGVGFLYISSFADVRFDDIVIFTPLLDDFSFVFKTRAGSLSCWFQVLLRSCLWPVRFHGETSLLIGILGARLI